MSKFDEYFMKAQSFNNDTYVITGNLERVDAALQISLETCEEVNPNDLKRDRVRFGFAPQCVEDHEDLGACWYSGASGKGSKEVWVYDNNAGAFDER
jgi:hypothetical protein